MTAASEVTSLPEPPTQKPWSGASRSGGRRPFRVVLIKPSRYDDEGYLVSWFRSAFPNPSLACLHGITTAVAASGRLGPDVDVSIDVFDEANRPAPVRSVVRELQAPGVRGVVCLVGVLSTQVPRALDLARAFRKAGLPVLMGGPHVGGSLSMPEVPDRDLDVATELGVTLVAGEVEKRLGDVLEDALHGRLKPLYDFLGDRPDLRGTAWPFLPPLSRARTLGRIATFDAGRGCPFACTFCTVISVQGHESRCRSADDVEAIVRANLSTGARRFFVTDDNFARNRNWEEILDRLALLRRRDGLAFSFSLQVDCASHRVPRFVEKAAEAGCQTVFIGLESLDAAALEGAGKRHNRVSEYHETVLAWRRFHVVVQANYIIGFPTDTVDSVRRHIEILKRELPIDVVSFAMLTPLPGSADHRALSGRGEWLEPDLNRYDYAHPCRRHPLMSSEEWTGVFREAWRSYYTPEHIETILRRRYAEGQGTGKLVGQLFWFLSAIRVEGVYPHDSGLVRRKRRTDRRPDLPTETRLGFALRRAREVPAELVGLARLWRELRRVEKRVHRDLDRTA